MKLLLTSCGLETEKIKEKFLSYLTRSPLETKAVFIPTAAIYSDAIEVLPKCLNDLKKCGIPNSNIIVYDLHLPMDKSELSKYDVVYICGGSPHYLLHRINEHKFGDALKRFLKNGGVVVGVSAGSIIFADNMPGNLGMLKATLNVHCTLENSEQLGVLNLAKKSWVNLGNKQAIVFDEGDISIIT